MGPILVHYFGVKMELTLFLPMTTDSLGNGLI